VSLPTFRKEIAHSLIRRVPIERRHCQQVEIFELPGNDALLVGRRNARYIAGAVTTCVVDGDDPIVNLGSLKTREAGRLAISGSALTQ
jgi:hypothetical protein